MFASTAAAECWGRLYTVRVLMYTYVCYVRRRAYGLWHNRMLGLSRPTTSYLRGQYWHVIRIFPFCQMSRTLMSGSFIFRAQKRRCVLEGFAHILYLRGMCRTLLSVYIYIYKRTAGMYSSTSSRNRGYSCTCTYIHSSSSTRCTAVHMNIYQVPARRYGSSKGYSFGNYSCMYQTFSVKSCVLLLLRTRAAC